MEKLKFDTRLIRWSIALLVLVYISGLFVPLTGDAGKYAAISRNIVESGDWINLQIHHQPYDQKPHLLFWLGALFFHVFGMSALVFKLPILLFSVLGFYSTFGLGRLLYNRQTGLLSMLILLSSEIWLLFSNDIHTDILMASATIFGLWQLFLFLEEKKKIQFVLGFVGIGLAILSKGIIAIAVPFFAIGGHLLARKQYRELFHPRWLIGIPILALFFLPTVVGIYRQLGTDGLRFYFWENNFGRMSGEYKGNNNDPFFYFHTALYILLPWSLWFFLSLYLEGKELLFRKWRDRANSNFILLCGIILFWTVVSAAKAKAPHFLLVIAPLAAILTAGWLGRIFSDSGFVRLRKSLNILVLILGPGMVLFAGLISFPLFPSSVLFWIIWGFLALMSVLVILKTGSFSRFVLVSVLGISAVNFSFNLVLFPGMFSYHSTIPACNIFNKLADSNDVLHTCNSVHRELFFYCRKPGFYFENADQLTEVVKQPHTWLYMDETAYVQLKKKGIEFDRLFVFRHKAMTRQSIRFLNPKTRDKSLGNMYLVEIRN
ncbi:MAG: glycosyltransferase family 39 protein [Prolixibacteraceae bacterium]|nr:glycosyltransferase family 39 protein [Prolixibacteraceae bacterium]